MTIEDIMTTGPVIAVLTIEDAGHARPVAKALVAGGVRVLEVTLRTGVALDAIAAMRSVEGAIVGAGTVTDRHQLRQAVEAGSEFIVSPGLTDTLGRAATDTGVPFLPGIATASDLMRGLDLGLRHFKFFPAEANGGVSALKALAGPFGGAKFCPTGGIRQETAGEWLAIPQVLCVGGSWLVGRGQPDPAAIERAAREATALRGE